MSSVDVFLSLSDNLQLKPFAEQYQVMAMTWEMIKNMHKCIIQKVQV